jgi:hypothetical protein
MYDPLDLGDVPIAELADRHVSGFDVGDLDGAVRDAVANGTGPERERLLAQLEAAPLRPDWPYVEPSDLPGIGAAWPGGADVAAWDETDAELRDRLAGAWLGRCAGQLGKPSRAGAATASAGT